MTDQEQQTGTPPGVVKEHEPPRQDTAPVDESPLRSNIEPPRAEAAPMAVNLLPRATDDHRTEVFGRTINLSLYDVVFISLGIFTVLEVIVGELLPGGWFAIVLLLALTIVKAFHVVWYYMHLNHDSRIFWVSLLVPAAIALLGLMYLAAVPVTGY